MSTSNTITLRNITSKVSPRENLSEDAGKLEFDVVAKLYILLLALEWSRTSHLCPLSYNHANDLVCTSRQIAALALGF